MSFVLIETQNVFEKLKKLGARKKCSNWSLKDIRLTILNEIVVIFFSIYKISNIEITQGSILMPLPCNIILVSPYSLKRKILSY